jgi:hypothetical protein
MESSRDPVVRPTATPETWRRVKTIAGAALDRPGTDRDRYIDDVCAGDDALRLEVLSPSSPNRV